MASLIPWHDCLVAIQVGPKAEEYLQTELFLLSVREMSTLPMDQIVIHCLDGVADAFKEWARTSGVRVEEVARRPDTRYCGQLVQLELLQGGLDGYSGVLMLNAGTLVLADLELPMLGAVCGQVMEYPTPPLHLLERLFAEAGIPLPEVTMCDSGNGNTLATLFRPGLLFVPAEMAKMLCVAWRSWVEWLLLRLYVFDSKAQRRLIGLVALAMALARQSIPSARLSANVRLPMANEPPLTSWAKEKPTMTLSYGNLSPFGVPGKPGARMRLPVKDLLESLVAKAEWRFFAAYKEELAFKAVMQPSTHDAAVALDDVDIWNRRPRIVLHAGVAAEATTSLQRLLSQQREQLLAQGVLYPETGEHINHPWLVTHLLAENQAAWKAEWQCVVSQLRGGAHTILLSAEGLFDYWWDFTATARAMLQAVLDIGDVELWICLPEPGQLARDLYLRSLCQAQDPVARSFGRNCSFQEAMAEPWFIRHCDYLGFLLEAQMVWGSNAVLPMPMDDGMPMLCMARLGVTDMPAPIENAPTEWSLMGVDLLRTLNKHALPIHEQAVAIKYLRRLVQETALSASPFDLTKDEQAAIRLQALPGLRELETRYGMHWD